MSSKGRVPSKHRPRRLKQLAAAEKPAPSTLASLSCDAWRTIGEMVGIEGLHRLAISGQRSLSNMLKRVLFRRLEVSSAYLRRIQGTSLSDLIPKMQLFAEMQAEELVISGTFLSPELVFLAARMVSSRSRMGTLSYDLEEDELASIPWAKTWTKKSEGVFVRGACDGSSPGDFATLKSLSFSFLSDPFDRTDDALFFRRVDMAEAVLLSGDGEQTDSMELPESLFNATLKVVPCPVFIADTLLSGLHSLETLELTCMNLREERHFDLTTCATLTSFTLTFVGGPKSIDSKFTAIRISGTERLTTLKFHNREEHRRNGVVWGGFPLCTRNVPNIRRLEMRCALWPQYWRRHKEQLCETLEELSLDLCILSDDAWTTTWPSQLRVLELKAIGVAKEKILDYSFWEQIHRDSVQHWRSKIRHLDPRKLPASLETLIIEDMGDANANDLELLGTDVVTSWNVDTERYIASSRPNDFSCALIGDGVACRWGDYLNLCFSEQTLQQSSLPCTNLKTLELGMHYGGVSNLDLLPSSLTRISMREITRRMPLEVEPLHSAFTTIFPSAGRLLNRTERGFPHLRSIKLFHGDWSFLLPLNRYQLHSARFGDMDLDESSPQAVDLVSCFLQSAFAILLPKEFDSGMVPASPKTLIKRLNRAWSSFKAEKRALITNWRMAFDLPSHIHTLVWNPDYDESTCLNTELLEDAEEHSASDSDSATAEIQASSPHDPLLASQSSSLMEPSSSEDLEEFKPVHSHEAGRSFSEVTSGIWNMKDITSLSEQGSFSRFLLETPWKWPFVGRHLMRIELRCVKRKMALDLWTASMPILDSLLITEDVAVGTQPSSPLELRHCTHALRELVLMLDDWSLILPHVYANIPLALTLERFVTSNSFDDEQISLLRRAAPTLTNLEIVPFERFEMAQLSSSRSPTRPHASQSQIRRESYLANMAILRNMAMSMDTDQMNESLVDYLPLANCLNLEDVSSRSTISTRFAILRDEGAAKYKTCEPATLVFTGTTWTRLSASDAECSNSSEATNVTHLEESEMDATPTMKLPTAITLDLIRSRLTKDVFAGVHFERMTLDPDLGSWTVPEGTQILDLTEDESGADPSQPQWSFDADSNIAIRIQSLKLPSTLTRLTLAAIEDDIQCGDLFSLLPASLISLHILNQTRSKSRRNHIRTSPPPPEIQDIFTPNLFILNAERKDLSWAPTTLKRLVCASRETFAAEIPDHMNTFVLNGDVLLHRPPEEPITHPDKPKIITRQRRKERSNSDVGDFQIPAAPKKKKAKAE